MKFKLVLIALIFSLFTFVSCKDESVDSPKQTVESVAAKNSLAALKNHFTADGSLARDGQNPTNNIIFDFCFDFVYPITLSYNTGTEVTVQDFEGLIDVLVNMTDDLYINGIAYPFQVEVFNDNTNSFETLTVNDEDAFMSLLESCSIGDNGQQGDCNCTEEYNPVCVTVQDDSGESFTIDFPNMCYAECEGFTQADVVDCDYSNPADDDYYDDCFDLVYPFSIINTDGETIQINDEDEFEAALYTNYYFDFVYPFNVETEVNGENTVVTINSEEELTNLLMQCDGMDNPCDCDDTAAPVCVDDNGQTIEFDNPCQAMCAGFTQADFVDCNPSGNDCDINNLTVTVGDCFSTTAYHITINFSTENYDGTDFMVEFADGTSGTYSLSDLPLQLDVDVSANQQSGWLLVTLPGNNCAEDETWEIPNCQ